MRIPAAASLALAQCVVAQPPLESPVAELRQLLRSDNAEVRRAAAERLGDVATGYGGLPLVAAVPELLAVFAEDADARVSDAAAWSLAAHRFVPHNHAALGALEHASAQLERWRTLGAGAQLLERAKAALADPARAWPGAAIVPVLVDLIAVKGCEAHALGVLAMLGPDAAPAAPAVGALLANEGAGVRWRAAFALCSLGVAETDELRNACRDDDAVVRVWATRARLAGAAPQPDFAALLLPWLADPRAALRAWAHASVPKLGDAAVPLVDPVARLLRGPHAAQALVTLTALGPRAPEAVPRLVELLSSAELDWAAAACLGEIGPAARAAVDPLLAAVASGEDAQADPVARGRADAAFQALARIDPGRALAALLPRFERPPDRRPVRWEEVERLRLIGPAAAPAVPRLRRELARGGALGQQRALLALGAIGEAALPALPDVLPLLESTEWHVAWAARRAVCGIGAPAAADALPAFEGLLARMTEQREDVVSDLASFGSAAEPLLVRAASDREAAVRASAIRALFCLPPTPAARGIVAGCSQDEAREVRESLLGGMHQPLWRDVVAAALRTAIATIDDPWVRRQAIEGPWFYDSVAAIERAGVGRRSFDGSCLGLLLDAWGFAQRPAAEWAFLGDRPRIASWACTFVAAEDRNTRLSVAAVLSVLASDAATRAALARLAADEDATVREAAVLALGRHGRAARAELPVLAKALRDRDWFVRAAAAAALRAVHRD